MAAREKIEKLSDLGENENGEYGTGERVVSTSERIDEILELIWTMREEGRNDLEEIIEDSGDLITSDLIQQLVRDGLISTDQEKIFMTANGEKRAAKIIRRHRLAETLLLEVFDLENRHVESNACQFEHILSNRVTESVCTFLGHPQICPHGKPIPPGLCCSKFQIEVKPLVQRLADFRPGDKGKIIFITPKYRSRLDRLSSLGIVPGMLIKLQQKQPSFVIEAGQTLVALDSEIVKEIYVKAVN